MTLRLDHLTVIAPTLDEGVAHVQDQLGLKVPFGTRHDYMGTHNHRLLLGDSLYLEIIAVDPQGVRPPRPRWFGLDNQTTVQADWAAGRRLRGWVASSPDLGALLARHGMLLGNHVTLPDDAPTFAFAIPPDGSLPLDGALPSVIDHLGDTSHFAGIPDLGARLTGLILEHPDPQPIGELYRQIGVLGPPQLFREPRLRYRALIQTPHGLRMLT
jgi:Glyoxalase-like domain